MVKSASRLLTKALPGVLILFGASFVVWAAWDFHPTIGKLVLGLIALYFGRNLALTDG